MEIKCSLCGAVMIEKKIRGNIFWECPDCAVELWPYDERIEKAVRDAMYTITPKKKKHSRGSKKKRFKLKKKLKWVPWYQRSE